MNFTRFIKCSFVLVGASALVSCDVLMPCWNLPESRVASAERPSYYPDAVEENEDESPDYYPQTNEGNRVPQSDHEVTPTPSNPSWEPATTPTISPAPAPLELAPPVVAPAPKPRRPIPPEARKALLP